MRNKVIPIFALATLALLPVCRAQSPLAGDWQGTLNTADGTKARIAWHVVAATDGSLTATIDNLDQNILAIPVKSMTLKGSAVTQIMDSVIKINGEDHNVRGSFEGTIDKDATEIKGTWTQTGPEQPPAEVDMKHIPAQTAASIAPKPIEQPQIAGDWQGVLSFNGSDLHVTLHIVAARDGTLSVTADNPDQGQMGTKASAASFKDSKLTVGFDVYNGVYEGTLSPDGSAIKGSWTQDQPVELNFKRVQAPAAPTPPPATPAKAALTSDLTGAWLGNLDTGAIKLRTVFKIATTADGLTVQVQSPDQSPKWFPATGVVRDGAKFRFDLKMLDAVYEGNIAADFSSIDGALTQRGATLPLKVKRITDESALEVRRPQNPVKPYPYLSDDVTYPNKPAGNTLAGTITIPPGKGPFPAVLLITGSGPNDRDETLLEHKPFLVLSDYLTRKGIVVLRTDKRGVGKSTGDLAKAISADFASDAEAGVAYLRTRSEVDPHKIGLIGHSEGGMIAPMAAVADPAVAFIVMMAGSGVPGDQIIVEQGRLIEMASGLSKEDADKSAEKERETLALVETEKDPAALDRLLNVKLGAEGSPESAIPGQIKALTSPWFRFFLTYDPATALRKLKIPVLAINGSLDLQVPPAQNLPAIRKALQDAGNTHAEVDELPGLNHLFQDAKTGAPSEYGQIEETISPVALDKIATWILKQ